MIKAIGVALALAMYFIILGVVGYGIGYGAGLIAGYFFDSPIQNVLAACGIKGVTVAEIGGFLSFAGTMFRKRIA